MFSGNHPPFVTNFVAGRHVDVAEIVSYWYAHSYRHMVTSMSL